MADRLKRRSTASTGKTGRLPRRTSLGAYLGGDEAAEAEYAYQRLQEAFARPLYAPPNAARFASSNDQKPRYENVGGLLGDSLPESGLSLVMGGAFDPVQIAPLSQSFNPLDEAGEVEGNSKTGRLRRPGVDVPVAGPMAEADWSLRELYVNAIADGLIRLGAKPWTAHKKADGIISLAEFSPLGMATAADEAKRAYDRGDYGEAALAALGGIPEQERAAKELQRV